MTAGLAFSPDGNQVYVVTAINDFLGRNLYVTGFDDNSLTVFARDAASGRLTFVEIVRGRDGN